MQLAVKLFEVVQLSFKFMGLSTPSFDDLRRNIMSLFIRLALHKLYLKKIVGKKLYCI